MRLCLFTDTLGDVNGVSRFIRNVAAQARASDRALTVITSTRFDCPPEPNIINVPPHAACKMPRYPQLELVAPNRAAVAAAADRLRPNAVHVSTPGPVGAIGRRYALRRGLPLVGTYHTDFPAYVDHLFDDPVLTWICTQAMRRFYSPFDRIFTRSADYAQALARLGIQPRRVARLLPGIDTSIFHVGFKDRSIWSRFPGIAPDAVKVLYVGRVSVEKNLPLLTKVWKLVRASARLSPAPPPQDAPAGAPPELIVVGDGPYRAAMQAELAGTGAHFLGFRHGVELSTIYASADLFVFPSTTDTLGQVVMEAQSAGLPVIVTDQGGPSEVVDHRPGSHASPPTGFVLPAQDVRAWSEVILRLVRDPALRESMGRAAHRKIQPMSIRHSFDHFWQVHEEAVVDHRMASGVSMAPAFPAA